ncbi:hypothetical protein IP84_15555 [beta proteobacterium AAP99]|nr:hypothetical protein IP84_15555 [beta proteobacterium AAP99]
MNTEPLAFRQPLSPRQVWAIWLPLVASLLVALVLGGIGAGMAPAQGSVGIAGCHAAAWVLHAMWLLVLVVYGLTLGVAGRFSAGAWAALALSSATGVALVMLVGSAALC